MKKTYEITLDIEKELYTPSDLLFSVSRNDFEAVEVIFTIFQDETRLNLTDTTVELAIKKPSGLTVYQSCEIVDPIQGKAKVMLSIQAYIEYGIYMAEIYIRNVDQLAVSSPFWYTSRAAIMESETVDSINDWSALQTALFAYDLKPIITDGFPTLTPEYVGQLAFDALNKKAYIANDLTSVSWQTIGSGEGGGGENDTILGIVAPAIAPARIGQLYIDTIGKAAYIATGATSADWEQIDIGGLTSVKWDEITEKPLIFPVDTTDAALVALFEAKADVDHNHDLVYAPIVHNHDLAYAPIDHDHTVTDITDFNTNVDTKITTALSGYTPTIPAEYLTATEGDLAYAPKVHNHDTNYYKKTETYSNTEVDTIVEGITQGGGTTVVDNLTSISTTAALSANQGRVLKGEIDGKASVDHDHDLEYAPLVHNHDTAYAPIVHNHDLAYAPIDHDHTVTDITDFNTSVDTKITTALSGYTPTIPAEYLTATEGDLAYAPKVHNHDTEYYKKTETYSSLEVDSIVEGITQGGGTTVLDNLTSVSTTAALSANQGRVLKAEVDAKANVDHNHDLAYAPIDHDHTVTDITDFNTNVDTKITTALSGYTPTIPAEYLTSTEGDLAYAPKVHNHDLAYAPLDHDHTVTDITDFNTSVDTKITTALSGYTPTIPAEYLTTTEGDLAYAPKIHNHDTDYAPIDHEHTTTDITDFNTSVDTKITTALSGYTPTIPAEYLTATEGDLAYAPLDHDHTVTDITDFNTSVDTKITTALSGYTPTIPAEYLTSTEGDLAYQAKGNYLTTVPLMSAATVGGALVGNGLGMSGSYLYTKTGAGLGIAGDNSLQVQTIDNVALKFWTGTQAAYDALTPDATTLYFVTG